MRILVVGAGATGGYFGAQLAAAGRDVTFLVRPGRAAALREGGLVVRSPRGDVRVGRPRLVTADELRADGPRAEGPEDAKGADRGGAYDLVLLGVKAYGLDGAIEDMAPAVGRDTMILPMLNGMRHMDVLDQRFGAAAVLGGACYVATTLAPDGSIHQLKDMQQLLFGDRQEPGSERIHAVEAALRDAGFSVRLLADPVAAMWVKWVTLASLGAITCLMRGAIGEVVAAPRGEEFARGVVDECLAVAEASGSPLTDARKAEVYGAMTEHGAPTTSSMYRDLRAGNRVEADQIVGDMVERGAALGVATPLLSVAYTHLGVYQASLA
ncbi:ketopantoate reductase family protein [Streptomyces sp. 8L]|uniref:ketopantoate reductase family protein n=1 Tax=Streptomyces sp. 8L TaxID=2877242 RepID=UPI001CD2BC59|nr:ketopantoate reductase family protein [Streptomyces sp. 8L]MCA1223462.1 ketopantoate reductase family protein [Streptomyces sp. 8L]